MQLTGRFNYEKLDRELGLGGRLVSTPDLANDPTIAAKILARFLKNVEAPSRAALQQGNLKRARKLVNGGTLGFLAFKEAFDTGNRLIA